MKAALKLLGDAFAWASESLWRGFLFILCVGFAFGCLGLVLGSAIDAPGWGFLFVGGIGWVITGAFFWWCKRGEL